MIVRWGLDELEPLLRELSIARPYVIATERWANLPLTATGRWGEVPTDRVADVAEAAAGADGLLAVGGGSAIDLAKAVSVETALPVVSVPTTYSGAEWAPTFGIRDPGRRIKGGGGGAHLAGIVYEPRLTYDLPLGTSVGTALNALAHCAEAMYVRGRSDEADAEALRGAAAIAASLPRVAADGHDGEARAQLLAGAEAAGRALGLAGLGLGHAMAQAVGGTYGIAHGAANALCLPPALRFNETVAAEPIARFAEAIGSADAPAGVQELARLGGFERLRDLGVPEDGLAEVAEAAAVRQGAKANPRPASAAEIEQLYREIW